MPNPARALLSLQPMPNRAMPTVGGQVLVDFLGATVPGIVTHVDGEGRRLEVETEDGAQLVFTLNRATAAFTSDGLTGARLRFIASSED